MPREIAKALQNEPIFKGPLSGFRSNFRSRLAESVVSGRLQTEMVVDTFKSLGRTVTYSLVDASIKPLVEKRIKRRFEK